MKPIWRQSLSVGSSGECSEGILATKKSKCGHPSGSLSASTRAILGAPNEQEMCRIKKSVATWKVATELNNKDKWIRGFLVAACLRNYGGCHTRTKDQEVIIFVNGEPFERFRLASIPYGHDDFFFRPPIPDIPIPSPTSNCETIYTWPILRERLVPNIQEITISIQPFVRWDIDYIGFLYQVEPYPEFDFALSFADEDRKYIARVAELLKEAGVSVFYDAYYQSDLWGKDLYVDLSEVYKEKSRYTVMFISKHYKKKLWANHERKSAQARAFSESDGYILPARFDDTEIPGLLPTVAYIDLKTHTPEQLVQLLVQKLKNGL